MVRIRQLHFDENGVVTIEHLIGNFEEQVVGDPRRMKIDSMELSNMGIKSYARGYVQQIYRDGAKCTDHGEKFHRHAEARIVCSPKNAIAMVVQEPGKCEYVFTIFIPGLCKLTSYQQQKGDHSQL